MKTMCSSLKRLFALAYYSIIICLTCSCENENIAARTSSEALFTLKVNKIVDKPDVFSQTPGQNKYYVIVADASGKMIEYQELKPNTTFTFDQPDGFLDNELTISFLYHSPKYGYRLTTYRNVSIGNVWKLNELDEDLVPPQPTLYKANVNVTNLPANVDHISVSTNNQAISALQSGTNYPITLIQNSGNEVWFRLSFTNNQPDRFFLLQNAEANKTYTLDLSKFETGNSQSIQLKEPHSIIWTWVKGIQQNQSHTLLMSEYESDNAPIAEAFNVSYPNSTFTTIELYTYLRKELPQSMQFRDDQQHVYGVFDAIPQTLPIMDADFEIKANDSGNFRMTTTGNFDIYTVQGYTQGTPLSSSLHWLVIGKAQPDIAFNFPETPSAIFQKSAHQIKMHVVTIEEQSHIQSYEEYLNKNRFADPSTSVSGNYTTVIRTRNVR